MNTSWKDKHDAKKLADECYPDAYYGNNPDEQVETTHEQRMALFRKWKQEDQGVPWGHFTKTVQPTFGMNDAIVVPWCGMFLAIETDGYTHS